MMTLHYNSESQNMKDTFLSQFRRYQPHPLGEKIDTLFSFH